MTIETPAADYPPHAVRTRSAEAVARLIAERARHRPQASRACLAAISGIDGSGKSHLSKVIAQGVERAGARIASIGIDHWQNPQSIRFGATDPGRHFYAHVIRFDDLFRELVDPLVERRSISLLTRGIRTDRDVWTDVRYEFENVDVVLVEGILLFQRALVERYDLRIWIECPFATALERALARNAEGRSTAALRRDYDEIYHAAQRHHFLVDAPQASADVILLNDDAA